VPLQAKGYGVIVASEYINGDEEGDACHLVRVLGAEFSDGSVVRQVVNHLSSFGLLLGGVVGQKRDLRKSTIFSTVR
jgi:hypothetical protein